MADDDETGHADSDDGRCDGASEGTPTASAVLFRWCCSLDGGCGAFVVEMLSENAETVEQVVAHQCSLGFEVDGLNE